MQGQDVLSFGIDLVKLVVTGFLGGLIAHWLGVRTFQSQKRFEIRLQDDIRRCNVLRDVLPVLEIVFADMYRNWEMPEGAKETSQEHIARLTELITRARSLFLGDVETMDSLNKLDRLIGASPELVRRTDRRPPEIIDEIRKQIENKIRQTEKIIYK